MLLTAILVAALAIFTVVLPFLRFNRMERERRFEEKLRFVKLWAIKKYYPALSDMTFEEIAETFDIDLAYNNIGRRYCRSYDASDTSIFYDSAHADNQAAL